jgi:hypothetical protein
MDIPLWKLVHFYTFLLVHANQEYSDSFALEGSRRRRGQNMKMVSGRVPQVSRLHDWPIVEAGSVPGYEAVFNAGLLYHDATHHLFARGVRDGSTPLALFDGYLGESADSHSAGLLYFGR